MGGISLRAEYYFEVIYIHYSLQSRLFPNAFARSFSLQLAPMNPRVVVPEWTGNGRKIRDFLKKLRNQRVDEIDKTAEKAIYDILIFIDELRVIP